MRNYINDATIVRLFWLLIAILAINVVGYVANTSMPHVRSDAWFFVSEFLMPWYEGQFGFTDIYTVRGSGDHVQPIHRTLLFINAILFDLNFRIEAIFGVLFLIASCLILVRHILQITSHLQKDKSLYLLLFSFSMIVLGFNTTVIYNWSLVTLGYMTVFINITLFILMSKLITNNDQTCHRSLILVSVVTALSLFVGDDIGILVGTLSVIVLGVVYAFGRKVHILKLAIIISSLVLLYTEIKAGILTNLSSNSSKNHLASAINFYFSDLSLLLEAIKVPLADSLLHISYLKKIFVEPEIASSLLGYMMICVHLVAWYIFIKYQLYRVTYVPVFLMLYSYALIAGILLYRVPDFGIGYLHSPRYIRAYQIGLWGMLMCYILYFMNMTAVGRENVRKGVTVVASFLILIQVCLILVEWGNSKYINKYSEEAAARLIYYSGESDIGKPCNKKTAGPICNMTDSERARLIGFLKDKRLNVFSDTIRSRYFRNLVKIEE